VGSPWTLIAASGVSPSGQYVVGRAANAAAGYSGGVLWELSPDRSQILAIRALGNMGTRTASGATSSAVSVNNSGQVTGLSQTGQVDANGNLVNHAYRVTPQDTDFDTLPDTWFVADTTPGSDSFKNVLMQDLGTLGGLRSSIGFINGLGQVAGSANNTAGYNRPVLWTEAAIQDLGAVPGTNGGVANGLNDNGQVVGECSGKAFVWDELRGIRDLNTLKAASDTSGLNLMSAYAVSMDGRIVGRGQGKGKSYPPPDRAFIAVPQP
jgi:hypothetical protein